MAESESLDSPGHTRSGTRFNFEEEKRLRQHQAVVKSSSHASNPNCVPDLTTSDSTLFPLDESQLLDSVTSPTSYLAKSDAMSHTPVASEAGQSYPPLQHSRVNPSTHISPTPIVAPLANSTASALRAASPPILPSTTNIYNSVATGKVEVDSLIVDLETLFAQSQKGLIEQKQNTGPVEENSLLSDESLSVSVCNGHPTSEVPAGVGSVPCTSSACKYPTSNRELQFPLPNNPDYVIGHPIPVRGGRSEATGRQIIRTMECTTLTL